MRRVSFKDTDFLRGYYSNGKIIPLTKYEIRVLTIDRLEISPGNTILDIGAGTGGLTLESARATEDGRVYAIEKSKEACALIRENARQFGLSNIEIIQGKAPEVLEKLESLRFDRVIIGGSSGNIEDILDWVLTHLSSDGIVCANFITLENCTKALSLFKKIFFKTEIIQVAITRGEFVGDITLMRAENPIYILTGIKGNEE